MTEGRHLAPLKERQKRYEAMVADQKAGMSLRAIAAKHGGMSGERVRRILLAPPRDAGWPVDRQRENARRRLNEQREKWAKRESAAAKRRVAEIDVELAALA